MAEMYDGQGAPGLIIYNAVMGAPDTLLGPTVEHLQPAYAVDVIGAIVVTQVAAPAMRAAGFGTIIVTGGGFAGLSNPCPCDRVPRQSCASIRGHHARGRFATRRDPCGDVDDHGSDCCGHRVRP